MDKARYCILIRTSQALPQLNNVIIVRQRYITCPIATHDSTFSFQIPSSNSHVLKISHTIVSFIWKVVVKRTVHVMGCHNVSSSRAHNSYALVESVQSFKSPTQCKMNTSYTPWPTKNWNPTCIGRKRICEKITDVTATCYIYRNYRTRKVASTADRTALSPAKT